MILIAPRKLQFSASFLFKIVCFIFINEKIMKFPLLSSPMAKSLRFKFDTSPFPQIHFDRFCPSLILRFVFCSQGIPSFARFRLGLEKLVIVRSSPSIFAFWIHHGFSTSLLWLIWSTEMIFRQPCSIIPIIKKHYRRLPMFLK